MERVLAVSLALMLAFTPVPGLCQDSAGTKDRGLVAAKVDALPPGSVIEVRFRDEKKTAVTGRLGPVRGDGFDVQVADAGKISSRTILYAEVASVKAKKGLSGLTKALIVAGIVTGGIFLGSALAGAATN